MATNFLMDAWMVKHLLMWCKNFAPVPREEADELAEKMKSYMETMDADDAIQELNEGWSHIYRCLNEVSVK